MAYFVVDDFAAGLDLRKSAITAIPGSLRELTNGFVNPGGEIEKRQYFSVVADLPPGTHGLAFDGEYLVVFGTADPAAIGPSPPYTLYRRLAPSNSVSITRVLRSQVFAGKFYVIARMSDGSVRHFYDGAQLDPAVVSGTNIRSHKSKLFAVDGRNLRVSALKSATDWSGTGSAIIDVTAEDDGNLELVGLEEYYGQLAVFGRTSVQLWLMDPDPAQSALQQVLANVGLLAPNAVTRYGSGDVLFLSNTGIRSLRARDISSAAAINDLGAPVDAAVAARRATLTPAEADAISAFMDPLSGHFWLVWGRDVFVLAAYPNSKITAWSMFTLPAEASAYVVANSRIALRVGDQIRIYGPRPAASINPFMPNAPLGDPANAYDSSPVTVELPFTDATQPATFKQWEGLDLSVEGEWSVFVNPDYTQPQRWTKIAEVGGPTWQHGRVPIDMESTHLAVRLVSVGAGRHRLSNLALHHSSGEAT